MDQGTAVYYRLRAEGLFFMDWNPYRTLLLELAGVGEGLEVAGVRERRAEWEVVRKKS